MHLPCCAATYDCICGAGRLLAARLQEVPQELPQVGMRRTKKRIWFRINTTILRWTEYLYDVTNLINQLKSRATRMLSSMPRWSSRIQRRQIFYGLIKKMDMSVPAYFKYFQCQTTKYAESTAGLYELRNKMIVSGPAYFSFFQCQITHVVTVLAYFNYSQYQTTEVAECTARYKVLRKMMIETGPAYTSYFQCLTTDEDGTTAMLRLLRIHGRVLSVLACTNYFQIKSTEETGNITSYHVLRNTKDTKSVALADRMEKKMAKTKIDVTQAGSDWSFKREFVNSNLRRPFFVAGDTHLSNAYIQEFKPSSLWLCEWPPVG